MKAKTNEKEEQKELKVEWEIKTADNKRIVYKPFASSLSLEPDIEYILPTTEEQAPISFIITKQNED